ncbi:hypothetical protein [Janthinobacterium sp.]|uniref:hypothetical protein n=1 Tax=Janthinobacterium sp. TaxID=1871054 RepID=UPI002615D09B|nr:hypothetical protein [Janthinobacterium sp.]
MMSAHSDQHNDEKGNCSPVITTVAIIFTVLAAKVKMGAAPASHHGKPVRRPSEHPAN